MRTLEFHTRDFEAGFTGILPYIHFSSRHVTIRVTDSTPPPEVSPTLLLLPPPAKRQ